MPRRTADDLRQNFARVARRARGGKWLPGSAASAADRFMAGAGHSHRYAPIRAYRKPRSRVRSASAQFSSRTCRGRAAKSPNRSITLSCLAIPLARHTYTSVGTVRKTVRRFTGTLAVAVNFRIAEKRWSSVQLRMPADSSGVNSEIAFPNRRVSRYSQPVAGKWRAVAL